MSKRAFDRTTTGLREALSIARGDGKPARLHIPPEIDVRYIRNKLRLSQDDFAAVFGFTLNQITAWEQGRSRPLGGVRAYLTLIDREPGTIITMLRPLREARQAA